MGGQPTAADMREMKEKANDFGKGTSRKSYSFLMRRELVFDANNAVRIENLPKMPGWSLGTKEAPNKDKVKVTLCRMHK